jgi:hypothetical protein
MTDARDNEPSPTTHEPSITIAQLCKLENISNATYHKLQKKGLGPATIRVPGTRLVRITAAARREWHERLAKLSEGATAKREAQRRSDQAARAAKVAVRSPKHWSKRGRRPR